MTNFSGIEFDDDDRQTEQNYHNSLEFSSEL